MKLVQDLDRKTDASILKKCASFFLENSQYDKAVPLLVKAGEFNQVEFERERERQRD